MIAGPVQPKTATAPFIAATSAAVQHPEAIPQKAQQVDNGVGLVINGGGRHVWLFGWALQSPELKENNTIRVHMEGVPANQTRHTS